jgi:FAD/FMN-containing dehydrogenase
VRFGPPERFWALRHSLSEGLRAAGEVVGFDLSLRRSEVMPFRRVAIAQLAAIFPEYEVCDFGHIADGGVHFNLVRRGGADYDAARVSSLRDRVLELAVRDCGASFSGEHGIGRANQAAYDQFTPAPVQRYSAAIAAIFARMPGAAVRFGPRPRGES